MSNIGNRIKKLEGQQQPINQEREKALLAKAWHELYVSYGDHSKPEGDPPWASMREYREMCGLSAPN